MALVPLIAFLIYRNQVLKRNVKLPEYYGTKIDSQKVDGKMHYDTVFHKVSNLKLINQLGDTVFLNETFKDKILVIDFFFTSCASICPALTANMNLLNRAYKKNDTAVRFISITVDTEHDFVPQLRKYADKQNANHDKWFFCTGNKKEIYDFARKDLMLSLPDGNGEEEDFIHPDQFVLIDQNRNVRGYYDGLDSNKVRVCAEDIAYLILENNTRKKNQ